MKNLTAADVMARGETTLSPELEIYSALDRLLRSRQTGAPVVDRDGRLLGMLTEKDCLRVLVADEMDGWPGGSVSDYMTSPAESVAPTTSVDDIVQVFLRKSFRKLPVVGPGGRVVGQVSRRDALVGFAAARDIRPTELDPVDPTPDGAGVDSAMKIARGQR